jgi:cytoskeletal protein CcmA (bactofilin family)
VRIEGTFEGDMAIRGLVVVGETGKVSCEHLRANTVVVAGAVKGNITAEKLEIRSTGRVWGDVTTVAFATEEGSFLRGQVRMEERVELNLETPEEKLQQPDGQNNGLRYHRAHPWRNNHWTAICCCSPWQRPWV